MTTIHPDQSLPEGSPGDWLEIVRKNAANLRFGSIQITVHDGRVTQVESIEKTRFVAPKEPGTTPRK